MSGQGKETIFDQYRRECVSKYGVQLSSYEGHGKQLPKEIRAFVLASCYPGIREDLRSIGHGKGGSKSKKLYEIINRKPRPTTRATDSTPLTNELKALKSHCETQARYQSVPEDYFEAQCDRIYQLTNALNLGRFDSVPSIDVIPYRQRAMGAKGSNAGKLQNVSQVQKELANSFIAKLQAEFATHNPRRVVMECRISHAEMPYDQPGLLELISKELCKPGSKKHYTQLIGIDVTRAISPRSTEQALIQLLSGKAKTDCKEELAHLVQDTENTLFAIFHNISPLSKDEMGNHYTFATLKLLKQLVNKSSADCLIIRPSTSLDVANIHEGSSTHYISEAISTPDIELNKKEQLIEQLDKRLGAKYTPDWRVDAHLGLDTYLVLRSYLSSLQNTEEAPLPDRIERHYQKLYSALCRNDFLAVSRLVITDIRNRNQPLYYVVLCLVVVDYPETLSTLTSMVNHLLRHVPVKDVESVSNEYVKKQLALIGICLYSDIDDQSSSEPLYQMIPRLKEKMTVLLDTDKESAYVRRQAHWWYSCELAEKVDELTCSLFSEHSAVLSDRDLIHLSRLQHLLASVDFDAPLKQEEYHYFIPFSVWLTHSFSHAKEERPGYAETLRAAYALYAAIEHGGAKKRGFRLSNSYDLNHIKLDIVHRFFNAGYRSRISELSHLPSTLLPELREEHIEVLGAAVVKLLEAASVACLRTQSHATLEDVLSKSNALRNRCFNRSVTGKPAHLVEISQVFNQSVALTSNIRVELSRLHSLIRRAAINSCQHIARLHIRTLLGIGSVEQLQLEPSESDDAGYKEVKFNKKETEFFIKLIVFELRIALMRCNFINAERIFNVVKEIHEKLTNRSGSGRVSAELFMSTPSTYFKVTITRGCKNANTRQTPPIGELLELTRLFTYFSSKHASKGASSAKGFIQDGLDFVKGRLDAILKSENQQLYSTNHARLNIIKQYLDTASLEINSKNEGVAFDVLYRNDASACAYPGHYLETVSYYLMTQTLLMIEVDSLTQEHVAVLNNNKGLLRANCENSEFTIMRLSLEIFECQTWMVNYSWNLKRSNRLPPGVQEIQTPNELSLLKFELEEKINRVIDELTFHDLLFKLEEAREVKALIPDESMWKLKNHMIQLKYCCMASS